MGQREKLDWTAFSAKASVDPIGSSGDGEAPLHNPELERGGLAFMNWCWPDISRGHSWKGKAASLSGVFPKGADNQELFPICTPSSWERKSFIPEGVYECLIRAATISWATSRWETSPRRYWAFSLKNQYSDVCGGGGQCGVLTLV